MDDEKQGGGNTGVRGSKEILEVIRRHWVALDKGILFFFLGVLVVGGGAKLGATSEILLVAGSIFALLFFGQFVSWWFSIIILTNGGLEIVSQKGLFKRGVVDIPFESIMNTNYATKGLVQAMLGFGTIVIQTQSGDIVLEKIRKPAKVHTLLTVNYNKFRGFDE